MTDMERLQQQVEVQQVLIDENDKAIKLIVEELRRLSKRIEEITND